MDLDTIIRLLGAVTGFLTAANLLLSRFILKRGKGLQFAFDQLKMNYDGLWGAYLTEKSLNRSSPTDEPAGPVEPEPRPEPATARVAAQHRGVEPVDQPASPAAGSDLDTRAIPRLGPRT